MKVEIENIKLAGCINVLDKLQLKGLKSIHRTRLINALGEKLQRIAEEERQLKIEHSNLDKEGNPIIVDGNYDIKDMDAFKNAMEDFYKEKAIIDGGDSQVFLRSVKQSLEESEIVWEGEEASNYAYLYDAFKAESKEDEE